MRPPSLPLVSLLFASLAVVGVAVLTSPSPETYEQYGQLSRRDGNHAHHKHNAQPILQLNETEILMSHGVTPASYYTIDFEGAGDPSEARHPGFMMAHIVFMSLAFFGALPIGIVLRSLRHPAHGVAMISFYALSVLGISSSGMYHKLTPNKYEGSVHGKQGYFIFLLAIVLSAVDAFQALRRLKTFIVSDNKSLRIFWRFVVLNQDTASSRMEPEYSGLIVEDPEELDFSKPFLRHSDHSQAEGDNWVNDTHRHRRFSSSISERTVFGLQTRSQSADTISDSKFGKSSGRQWVVWIGQTAFVVLERSLLVAGFGQVLSGVVVYTGGCRSSYINSCLAHLIKGGIFWCYGLLTFARFLGSFADRGWAWNQAPQKTKYTAEFVESFIIFLYGITNTWMERFGARAGDPYTTKEIQHISIAVMFWFAGLLGMGIESRRVRRWLASSTFSPTLKPAELPHDAVTEPPSYLSSFNPFPALVIGVTGATMAAHFQTYVFQVQIHQLWGNLLVAFSVLRCLTYFFLWLSPPKSILPSRPPTEALAGFFLTCGGLMFIFSNEEITVAAMRRGRDDVMMFLNVAVAITCLACCWTLGVVGLKGYLKSRSLVDITYRSTDQSHNVSYEQPDYHTRAT